MGREARPKKRFYLGQKAQMSHYVGVGVVPNIINHSFYGLFDHFFVKFFWLIQFLPWVG